MTNSKQPTTGESGPARTNRRNPLCAATGNSGTDGTFSIAFKSSPWRFVVRGEAARQSRKRIRSHHRGGTDFSFDRARQLILRNFQIVGSLKIHPKRGAGIEVPSQAQGRVWGDSTAFVNDLGDPCDRHSQIERQAIHAELKWLHELGTQNLAGMDRGKEMLGLSHCFLLLRASAAGP